MNYDVIIATYNGEKYIIEQLESIVNQTIKPSNIYIRDDGSQDKTVEIVKDFILKSEINIELKNDGLNLGYIKNFEKLIEFTKSEIIFFSDQDDIWVSKKAELLINKFKDDNTSVVFSDAYLINNNKERLGTLWEHVNYHPKLNNRNLENVLINNIVTGATVAVERSFLISLLPFPDAVPHDHWISSNAVIKDCLSYCDEKLILYRQHDNNQIGASKTTLKAKIKGVFSRAKMNKRVSYYIQIHKLIESLISSGALNAEQSISLEMRKFIILMNIIYKGKVNRDVFISSFDIKFLSVFFKKEYLRYKTKKVIITDIIDAIFSRTIYKD